MNYKLSEIQTQFLTKLYLVKFVEDEGGIDYAAWAEENDLDHQLVFRTFDELEEKALVKAPALGPCATITPRGIEYIEENKGVDRELIQGQQRFRTKFLDALAKVRDEHGLNAYAGFRDVLAEINATEADFDRNYEYLDQLGTLEHGAIEVFRISAHGYRLIENWRKQVGLGDQYRELMIGESITPQKRGHELERLLEIVLRKEGWQVERNTRAPGEENDLIFHRDFDYFILSAKWEKTTIEAGPVRDLRDRVTARAGTRGILVSISGFSQNATDLARERMESAMILFFGPEDVKTVFIGGKSLSDQLKEKMRFLVIEKRVVWR